MFIVVGLGNPGLKYKNTRHNVGFSVLDLIASELNINIGKLKHRAIIGEGNVGEEKIVLVKPQTYMNLSGESIKEIVDWYRADILKLILIYDDIDLPLGKIRIRRSGSAGSHNGMRSILYHIKSEQFPRIRIGIGKPSQDFELAEFVLSKFTSEESEIIKHSIEKAAKATLAIIKNDIEYAINNFSQ